MENWRATILESVNCLLSTTLGDKRKEEFMECIWQQEAKSVLGNPCTDKSGSSISHFKDIECLLEQCEDAALNVAPSLLHLLGAQAFGWIEHEE